MKSKRQQKPFWLDPYPVLFPPTKLALTHPDGLLAVGGDLTPEWLLNAYHNGIFPWFNDDDPILWWSPSPRSVLFIENLIVRRSLVKTIRKQHFKVTLDTAFTNVMKNCSKMTRPGQNGTWILPQMITAYSELHEKGHAHSVEVWLDGELVGGLYGMALGKVFYGESMFAKVPDASKVGFVALCQQLKAWGFAMIDSQVETPHLKSLGTELISRELFESILQRDTQKQFPAQKWQFDLDWQAPFLITPTT